MKKFITFILLLCCFAMVFGLVACTPTDTPPADEENPGEDKPGDVTPPDDGNKLTLFNEDGTFRYRVVRPERNDVKINKAAAQLRITMQEIFNTEVEISDDWVSRDIAEEEIAGYYEILIGNTNRPESKQVLESLEDYTYKIQVVGNKIVLAGKSEKAILLAVECFTNTYLKDTSLITETLDYLGTYEVQPFDVVLKDNSNGRVKPRVIKTKYATDDVVIADIVVTEDGYAVSTDGIGDSTAGIQKALNDCAKNGGGTVYLPAGVYTISGKIEIPPYVTLRGDWQDPDEGNEYGTVICIYGESQDKYAPGQEVIEGTFMLGGSGGVIGLTVYYPEQSLDAIRYYPFAFYTDGNGNNYMLSTVKNVTVLNGFRGIGACCNSSGGAHEQLTVENFKGTFLYTGAEVYNQADVGTWQDVVISNKYWKEATAPKYIVAADAAKLDAYTKENAVGLKLGDLEWTEFESLKVSDCSIGIEIMVGKRIQFAGSLLDIEILNCGKGMLIHQLDRRWGMVIARSTIENGIYNYSFQNNAGGDFGMVKLCDVKVTGEIKGEYLTDESDLSAFVVDFKRTYVKPVEILYVADLDKTGNTDVSDALQAKLNEAAATGGVVYLPGGYYRLDKPIDVPAGVELRGSSSVATREQGWKCNGTVILSYYGDDATSKTTDRALITLAGDYAGLNGIRIIYPENGPYDENLNTTFAVRGQGKGVYMVNAMISAAAYGVDFRDCDEHFIKKVTTCCYYNTYLLGGENGMLNGCLQNGTVLARTSANHLQNWLSEGNVFTDLFDPITRPNTKYIVLEGAKDQQIYNTFAYGVANMVVCNDSTGLVANIGSDNLGTKKAQIVMNSGELVTINSMRWNGTSYEHNGGALEMYNRLTINIKNEETYNKTK
ncbi:MAG: hypothetical protein IJW09_06570 [Clostridia bacterium]|nr:hypothetical protein [Clostridia bacterium]